MSQAQTLPTEHFPPSVSLIEGRPATTSLAIAECFGKRHDDVTKSIRNLHANCPEEFRARNFAETFRTVAGPNNSQRQEKFFTVYFDGFILLVMGYTGKKALQMKLAYIEAFNAMKEQIDKLAEQERARLAEPVGNPDRLTSTDSISTAASRKPLRALVHAWAQISGTPHTALWPQVKAHFQLERIDDLPEEWIPDALEWVQGKIDSLTPALPPTDKESLTVAPPTALPFRADFPEDMDAGRKDALRKIRSIMDSMLAARSVVNLFLYPRPVNMDSPRFERLAHNAQHDFYAAALDCLSAAHQALEAGYRLGRQNGRG